MSGYDGIDSKERLQKLIHGFWRGVRHVENERDLVRRAWKSRLIGAVGVHIIRVANEAHWLPRNTTDQVTQFALRLRQFCDDSRNTDAVLN